MAIENTIKVEPKANDEITAAPREPVVVDGPTPEPTPEVLPTEEVIPPVELADEINQPTLAEDVPEIESNLMKEQLQQYEEDNSVEAQLNARFADVKDEDLAEAADLDKPEEDANRNKPISEWKGVVPGAMYDAMEGLVNAPTFVVNSVISAANGVASLTGIEGQIPEFDDIKFAEKLIPNPQGSGERLTRGLLSFVAGFGAISKLGKANSAIQSLGNFKKTALLGTVSDALMLDPDEGNLSNLIQEHTDIKYAVLDILSTNPKHEAKAVGRAKNMIEGFLIGSAFEGVKHLVSEAAIPAVKWYRDRRIFNKMKGGKFVPVDAPTPKAPMLPEGQVAKEGDQAVKAVEPEVKMVKEPTKKLSEPELAMTNEVGDKFFDPQTNSFKLTKIKSGKDIEDALKEIAKSDLPAMKEAGRGTMKLSEIEALAKSKGLKVEDVIGMKKGDVFNAERARATVHLLEKTTDNIMELAKKAKGGTDIDKFTFIRALDNFREINIKLNAAKSETARTMRVFQVPSGTDAYKKRFIENALKMDGRGNIDKIINRLSDVHAKKGMGGILDITRKSYAGKMKDAAFEVWINGLLSSPMTHLRNLVGNTSAMVGRIPETYIAEKGTQLVNVGRAALGKEPIKGVAAGETAAVAEGLISTFSDLFQVGSNALKEGKDHLIKTGSVKQGLRRGKRALNTKYQRTIEPISNLGTKSDLSSVRALSSENLGFAEGASVLGKEVPGAVRKGTNGAIDLLGTLTNIPGKGLVTSDEFFKLANYRMELHTVARRTGYNNGLRGKALNTFIADTVSNPGDIIKMKALDAAQDYTFTKSLEGAMGNVEEMVKTLGKDAIGVAPLRAVAPFMKTNANLITFALERTPAAPLFMPSVRNAVLRGSPAQKAMAISKITLGTTVMGAISKMTADGHITGGGPLNPGQNRFWRDSGHKPYNLLNIQSFDNIDPFGRLMKASADITEIAGYMQAADRGQELQSLAIGAASTFMEFVSPEFLTESMGDLTKVIQGDEREVKRFVSNMATTLVPFVSASKFARRVVDDKRRDTSGSPNEGFDLVDQVINNIKNSIPGWSKDLPVDVNIHGEERLYSIGWGEDISSTMDSNIPADKDPIKQELVRLKLDEPINRKSAKPGSVPTGLGYPSKSISYGHPTPYYLEPGEYQEIKKLSAGIGLKGHKHILETVKDMMNTDVYKQAPNDDARRNLIKPIYRDYREAAREQFKSENQDLFISLQKQAVENITRQD